MSKRAGTYLTLREVVERVGADALKFTMMTKKHDTKLDFDFDKICEQSKDNPIFYVQYASARVNSATKRAELLFGINLADLIASKTQDERCAILALLNAESDMAIIRTLASFPRILMAAVQYSEPHRLAFYLYDLAEAVHNAWNFGIVNKDARFVSENKDLTLARMMMMLAVKKTIISGLEIFGISALEEML